MSEISSEINALINLIEDPDEVVFNSIKSRFIGIGTSMIPVLKEQMDYTQDLWVAKKFDDIIFSISIDLFAKQIESLLQSKNLSILDASIITSQFIDNEMDRENLLFEIEKIKRSIWLELNDYLTPLEEINIFNKIIFSYYKIKGKVLSHKKLEEFSLSKLLTLKNGNSYTTGALYLILAEQLNIPLKPVKLPKQNLLAYVSNQTTYSGQNKEMLLFYVDPLSGQVYTQKDIDGYLKKMNAEIISEQPAIKSIFAYINQWLSEIAMYEKMNGDLDKHNRILETLESLNEN